MANAPSARGTAADLMTPSPRSCSPYSTVLEAVLLFRDADCGSVPVLDAGKPVGVLTDRDVALALATYEGRLPTLPVGEIMSRDVVAIGADEPIEVVIEKFGGCGVRRLLVTDANQVLVGIIAWSDVAPHVPAREIGRVVTEVVSSS
jgi:CBS domain-containing protein